VTVGGSEFAWIYAERQSEFDATNKERQEDRFRQAWEQLASLLPSENRHLFASLQYFLTACRLERAGVTPWEFMAEVLLNYAKVLEVLFPGPDGKTIDAARAGLAELGFSSAHIEKWFIPALALRSNLDVAHISLGTFRTDQLEVLHSYSESAEDQFRDLLRRVMRRVEDGNSTVPSYLDSGPSRDADRIIRRMARHFQA